MKGIIYFQQKLRMVPYNPQSKTVNKKKIIKVLAILLACITAYTALAIYVWRIDPSRTEFKVKEIQVTRGQTTGEAINEWLNKQNTIVISRETPPMTVVPNQDGTTTVLLWYKGWERGE